MNAAGRPEDDGPNQPQAEENQWASLPVDGDDPWGRPPFAPGQPAQAADGQDPGQAPPPAWGSPLPPFDAFSSPAAPPPDAFGAVPPPDYGPAAPHESFSGSAPPYPHVNEAAPPEAHPTTAAPPGYGAPAVPPPSYGDPAPPPAPMYGTPVHTPSPLYGDPVHTPPPVYGDPAPPSQNNGPQTAPPPQQVFVPRNEPWVVQSKRQRGFPKTLVLAVAGALIVVGAGTFGVYSLVSSDTPAAPTTGIADSVFTSAPDAASDGGHQVINAASAVGSTVVVAGSEHGSAGARPRFLVSQDAGVTWDVAAIKTETGATAGGAVPLDLVGATGAWLALGRTSDHMAAWRSADGRSWAKIKDGASAFHSTDHLQQLAHSAQAYVAAGYRQEGDGAETPVIWLSTDDGSSWKRLEGGGLKLPVKGGSVGALRYVAAVNQTVLVAGEIRKSGKNNKDADPIAGIWRSEDGGQSWSSVAPPQTDDAFGDVHVAATSAGFLALRKAKDGDSRKGLVSFSADGKSWETRGSFPLGGGEAENFQRFVGGDQGFAALATTPGNRLAVYRSADGATWTAATDLGQTRGRTINGLAVAQGGAAIAGGFRQGGDQDFYLNRIDESGRSTDVDMTKIPHAVDSDRSVQALATAAGQTIAVGGTNGDAAAWTSRDGSAWRRSDSRGLSGPGVQILTAVTTGPQGWLAVGSDGPKPLLATLGSNSWQRLADPLFTPQGDKNLTLNAAAYSAKGYVVVGFEGDAGAETSAAIWHSPDLKTWKRVEDDDLRAGKDSWHRVLAVAATSSGYVAVGEAVNPAADAAKRSQPEVWTSTDGLEWTPQRATLPDRMESGHLTHVVVNGPIITALGQGLAIDEGRRAFAITSRDAGLTWSALPLPLPAGAGRPTEVAVTAVTAVTAGPSGFAVAGTTETGGDENVVVWTSADGQTWQATAPQGAVLSGDGVQRLTGLTSVGNRLLGVGFTEDTIARHVTLWYGPTG